MAESDLLHVTGGNADFAKKFYSLISKESGNVFFSPISAHAVLSMAFQGAAGNTAKSFSTALSLKDNKIAAKGYNSVMNTLNNVPNVTLHIANKIFTMEGFALNAEFVKTVTEEFLSATESVDFAKNVEAAKKINGWVEGKTNNKIKDLITPDCLDALTRLVLVNAVYFKGNWARQFRPENTKTEPFFVTETEQVECQMMHITKRFRYQDNEVLNAQILELPYTNENISMVIILPNNRSGIKELEAKLADVDLSTITKDLYSVEVEVSLPKFKIETTMDLKEILCSMGLGIIFDQKNADFSGIAKEPLYVSKVIQKAFIEVNEEGAEAAAATGMVFMTRCMPMPIPPRVFIANHPFLIALLHKDEIRNTLMFFGRISNVSEK